MTNVLVVAEIVEGVLKKSTHSAITFAREVIKSTGGHFTIIAIGAGASSIASQLASFGASQVLVADAPELKNYLAEKFAPTLASVAQNYNVVVATATGFGKDLMPRVAAKLSAGYASDVSALQITNGQISYKRPMFAGNAYGWVQVETPVHVVSVRQSEFVPAEPSGGSSPINTVPVVHEAGAADRVEFLSFDVVKSERPELTEAKVVVSGGRALKEQFMNVLTPLADLLGAAIGASRAACDAGYAPSDLQVGQTGKVVAPSLYFAIGISGAIQHLAGMKSSKTIVAINKDGEAPIFQVADYGLVGDLFTVVPELINELKKQQ